MKKNKVSDYHRLEHILSSINSIKLFIQNVDEAHFLKDYRLQSAVLYQFIIIGEAAASLSSEIQDTSEYKWYKPKAFRNFLAHEYFDIDNQVIWKTIQKEIPELEEATKRLLTNRS